MATRKAPEPVTNESRYVDFDEETQCYGVFGTDSGFCYRLYASKEEADDSVEEHQRAALLRVAQEAHRSSNGDRLSVVKAVFNALKSWSPFGGGLVVSKAWVDEHWAEIAPTQVVHSVEVTQYSRPDKDYGRVSAHKTLENDWTVCCHLGPCWMWNDHTGEWDITSVSGFPYKSSSYRMTEERAKEVLSTTPSKQEESK